DAADDQVTFLCDQLSFARGDALTRHGFAVVDDDWPLSAWLPFDALGFFHDIDSETRNGLLFAVSAVLDVHARFRVCTQLSKSIVITRAWAALSKAPQSSESRTRTATIIGVLVS